VDAVMRTCCAGDATLDGKVTWEDFLISGRTSATRGWRGAGDFNGMGCGWKTGVDDGNLKGLTAAQQKEADGLRTK